MKPPKADEIHCTSTAATAAETPTAVAEGPVPGHGETMDNPTPEPRMDRMIAETTAATAPAMIAPHDREIGEASGSEADPTLGTGSDIVAMSRLPQCQNSNIRMMIGIGIPSSHSKHPRPILSSQYVARPVFRAAECGARPIPQATPGRDFGRARRHPPSPARRRRLHAPVVSARSRYSAGDYRRAAFETGSRGESPRAAACRAARPMPARVAE
jgi:hypothetical protein